MGLLFGTGLGLGSRGFGGSRSGWGGLDGCGWLGGRDCRDWGGDGRCIAGGFGVFLGLGFIFSRAVVVSFPEASASEHHAVAATDDAGNLGSFALWAFGQGRSLDRLEDFDNAAAVTGIFIGGHGDVLEGFGGVEHCTRLSTADNGRLKGLLMNPWYHIAVVGTDTGVGKTRVATLLVAGLRGLGRKVWIHKPIACGDWSSGMADDGRTWSALTADGQPPESVCPYQFPEPASPHLSAAAAGRSIGVAAFRTALAAVRGDHDLVIEGAGGVLTPLSCERATILDVLAGTGIPLLVVTRPDLGTLNHTALTVECARRRGVPLMGLVLNRPRPVPPGVATDHAAAELVEVTGLPLIADLPYGVTDQTASSLAVAVRERHHHLRS